MNGRRLSAVRSSYVHANQRVKKMRSRRHSSRSLSRRTAEESALTNSSSRSWRCCASAGSIVRELLGAAGSERSDEGIRVSILELVGDLGAIRHLFEIDEVVLGEFLGQLLGDL